MLIPKISFRYSIVYDDRFRERWNLQNTKKQYPSQEKIRSYKQAIEKIWNREGKKILSEIPKITGLKWQEKEIKCYLVGKGRCFSDPLTMSLFESKSQFIDVLTHELIHQIQTQNHTEWKKWEKYISIKHGKEAKTTRNHILVHAVHYQIFLKLFSKNRLEKEITSCEKNKDYKRAWDIVLKESSKKILMKFRQLTK